MFFLIQVVTNTKFPKTENEEEIVDMCEAIEEMINDAREEERKAAKEAARNCFINGADIDFVIKSITTLTEEEIVSIYEEISI